MNSSPFLRLRKSLSLFNLRLYAQTASSDGSKYPCTQTDDIEPTIVQMAEEEEPVAVPAFLNQTKTQILEKFHEISWSQWMRTRLAEANNDPNSQWALDSSDEIIARNRYFNIQPWANNRVRLKVPEGQNDYINASPITVKSSVTGKETRFIATQGPIESQINQFWRMVLAETTSTGVIIMLTQLTELGKVKCARYYPEAKDDTLDITDEGFGDGFSATIKVEEVEEIEAAQAVVRKLEITAGEESRTFWHMLFLGWADFQVPENSSKDALSEFMKLTRERNTNLDNARIIHCSAGVGRSGTFIALEHLLKDVEEGAFDHISTKDGPVRNEDDPIFEDVDQLRQQRMFMVQSEVQYLFLYKVLQEAWLKRKQAKQQPST